MLNEIFGFSEDVLGSVPHLALLLIFASLVTVLLVRLGFLIFATERVKESKQAAPQPVYVRKWPLSIVPPDCRTIPPDCRPKSVPSPQLKSSPSPQLLSASVLRFLDEVQVCNPEPKNERAEDQLIRSQKDSAAEIFRSARMERIRQSGWNS